MSRKKNGHNIIFCSFLQNRPWPWSCYSADYYTCSESKSQSMPPKKLEHTCIKTDEVAAAQVKSKTEKKKREKENVDLWVSEWISNLTCLFSLFLT